ncbi:neuronal acetylcholine receptor subunit alpha-7-like [Amphibalanus amphitrite]|uniref:neuronal acetylcholine receptor subunit alpha-7-like n=1 Tax=Amphibalanus amphitrite TaxID=1232801 RepID=UPI001C91DA25|nr:neuronal acetylcholine receptor subunit alpha-7-like [Amphibalanus amphitrite]
MSWMGKTLIVVNSDGSMLYVPPSSLRVFCRRDYHAGPHLEEFRCTLKLGSWTYNGHQVDIDIKDDSADLSSFIKTGEIWELQGASIKKNTVYYECCQPYVDATLEVKLRRSGSLSAWPNLPVAVSLLTALAGLLVPVDSPQKLTLPCLSVLAAGGAALAEFGLVGTAEYRAHYLRTYHAYTYIAVAVLLWTVLVVVLGRPRACRLPACLRRLLTGCLACVCCLAAPPEPDAKGLCHEWTALAGLLDRLAFLVFLVLIVVGSASSMGY